MWIMFIEIKLMEDVKSAYNKLYVLIDNVIKS